MKLKIHKEISKNLKELRNLKSDKVFFSKKEEQLIGKLATTLLLLVKESQKVEKYFKDNPIKEIE